MESSYKFVDFFQNKDKAIDYAMWMNFKYRVAKIKSGIIDGPADNWGVLEEATLTEIDKTFLDVLPKDYSNMAYKHIEQISMDDNPLQHWEAIQGMISIMDGEVLRFILHTKIPLEKFIRYELAGRGHDENHRWCGHQKACKIWLKK